MALALVYVAPALLMVVAVQQIYRILFDPTTLQVERILLADATGTPP